jgi:hypothetical protein
VGRASWTCMQTCSASRRTVCCGRLLRRRPLFRPRTQRALARTTLLVRQRRAGGWQHTPVPWLPVFAVRWQTMRTLVVYERTFCAMQRRGIMYLWSSLTRCLTWRCGSGMSRGAVSISAVMTPRRLHADAWLQDLLPGAWLGSSNALVDELVAMSPHLGIRSRAQRERVLVCG